MKIESLKFRIMVLGHVTHPEEDIIYDDLDEAVKRAQELAEEGMDVRVIRALGK